jgi:hypothetical protein
VTGTPPSVPRTFCFPLRCRRECVDHVVILGEQQLCEVLKCYASYYSRATTNACSSSRMDQGAGLGERRLGRLSGLEPGSGTKSLAEIPFRMIFESQ